MENNSTYFASLAERFNLSPFNRLVGLRIERIAGEGCEARLAMRPDLVGNEHHRILHGGVSSAVLDTIGGATACAGAWERMTGSSQEEREKRVNRLGTLDMRVDYLRPGRGEWFVIRGVVLRAGGQAIVTRMEMHNDSGDLIAAATGTYLY